METQAELLALLQEDGFDVTQATVSRDIAQLGLVKVRTAGGRARYAATCARGRGARGRVGAHPTGVSRLRAGHRLRRAI